MVCSGNVIMDKMLDSSWAPAYQRLSFEQGEIQNWQTDFRVNILNKITTLYKSLKR